MDILFTINKNSEALILEEVKEKIEKLKQIAYNNKNQTLVDEINELRILGQNGVDFSEDTFFN